LLENKKKNEGDENEESKHRQKTDWSHSLRTWCPKA
jgi:hypothetical protein